MFGPERPTSHHHAMPQVDLTSDERNLFEINDSIAQAIARKDWDNPVFVETYGDLVGQWDAGPYDYTMKQWLHETKRLCEANPAYKMQPVCGCLVISRRSNRAVLWYTIVQSGLPAEFGLGRKRETVFRMTWRKRNGKWTCTKNRHMMGSGFVFDCPDFPTEGPVRESDCSTKVRNDDKDVHRSEVKVAKPYYHSW
jgi:hypothetical protein